MFRQNWPLWRAILSESRFFDKIKELTLFGEEALWIISILAAATAAATEAATAAATTALILYYKNIKALCLKKIKITYVVLGRGFIAYFYITKISKVYFGRN